MKKYIIGKDESKKITLVDSGEYLVELAGEGAEAHIKGGWYLKNAEELRVKLTIVHQACHTKANTILKAVVADTAQADLRGKIIVAKGAQQTQSFLREAVLLVSPTARATAVPDLEIEANEVHCSHAAAVGKIDEEQLYYLMSKGISKSDGIDMIVEGFLIEVGI